MEVKTEKQDLDLPEPSSDSNPPKQNDLLPCPFCGHDRPELLSTLRGWYRWFVQCEYRECRSSTNNFDLPDEAIKAWNKRAPSVGALNVTQEKDLGGKEA